MRKKTKLTWATAGVVFSLLLSGCSLSGGEKKNNEIDPPKDVSYTDEANKSETNSENSSNTDGTDQQAAETVMRELYLIDENGMVVSQSLKLPKTDAVAKQALEYLVVGGPVTEVLPSGFRAVIPQDTKISVNIKGNKAIADFSKEFTDYKAEDETKILQAVTWTLTQFDGITEVELRINGHKLEEMPVNSTPISATLSRADGINIDTSSVVDITNTRQLTLYFLAENEGNKYYVPVTRRVDKSEKDNVTAIINELIKGPGLTSKLVSEFQSDVKLLSAKTTDGKVTLDFNESIFGSFNEKMISQSVLDAIVLSLTEQTDIESVAITVNGSSSEIVTEDGKALTEPVTRPQNVNTGSF